MNTQLTPHWRPNHSRKRVPEAHGEAGDTLIEILIAMVVLALAVVAMLTAFGAAIASSSVHTSLTSMDTVLRTASEEATVQIPAITQACEPDSAVQFTLPSSYTASVTNPTYWNTSNDSWSSACIPSAAQQFTVTVTSNGTTASLSTIVGDTQPTTSSGSGGTAAKLVFVQNPGGGIGGYALYPQPVLEFETASGSPVGSDLAPITLTITPVTGSGTLTNCSPSPVGVDIYFTGCTISTAGTYTMTATATDAGVALSATTNTNIIVIAGASG